MPAIKLLQWATESGRTVAFPSHVMTNSAVFTGTFFETVDAEIMRRTFFRTVSAYPTCKTLAPSIVRVTRRSVLALAIFRAEFAKFPGWTRYTETNTSANKSISVWTRSTYERVVDSYFYCNTVPRSFRRICKCLETRMYRVHRGTDKLEYNGFRLATRQILHSIPRRFSSFPISAANPIQSKIYLFIL